MARWNKLQTRGRVQDRRGTTTRLAGGIGTIGILVAIGFAALGEGDIALEILNQLQQQPQSQVQTGTQSAEFAGEDAYEQFASTVLGSNNDLWQQLFTDNNLQYSPPTLVLFRGATNSACGGAVSQVGPHYCPVDATIYLDETFFNELQSRFGAKGGDVAEAYVIAHEVGHHVQNLLGINEEVQAAKVNGSQDANKLSINLELQADCLAGLWANSISTAGVFEQDEILEAIDAAEAVGDDSIQEKTTGVVQTESWTHGSSQQRKDWFNRGYESGSFEQCNTFSQTSV